MTLLRPTLVLAVVTLVGCGVNDGDTANSVPRAVARVDSLVAPGAQLLLSGSTSSDQESISQYEWLIEGQQEYLAVETGDTTISVPPLFDRDFTCVLRVTDHEGETDTDTSHTLVSWIRSPNGGEVFTIGDTMHIELFPIDILVGCKLIVDKDGEQYRSNLPGLSESFVPVNNPSLSCIVPEMIRDVAAGIVETVSDSCRIQIFEYGNPGNAVSSALFFRIRQ